MSESSDRNYFHYWLKILQEALAPSLIEPVKKSEDSEAQLLEKLKEYELIVDSYDRDRPRPVDNQ